jgi:hypothetical protein
MKIMLSALAKLLAAIAGVFSLSFFVRRYIGSSREATPEEADARHDQGRPVEDPRIHVEPGEPLRPGWSRPAPEKMPEPTYWPMVFGLGVAFFMWGIISNLFVLGLGFALLVVAVLGWIWDLLGEFRE